MSNITAPVIATSRLRMKTDGDGITTLVCFHGCPLRCKYCLNPFSFSQDTKKTMMTAEELYQKIRIDELYFISTGGGVTFGGGEPLLYAPFIKQFRKLCGNDWQLCAETSLAVPFENVRCVAECVDMFYVDCKDADEDIYFRYTGQSNALMLDNLKKLLALVGPERITVRVPLIPHFNSEENRKQTRLILSEIGIDKFDFFTYKIS